MDTSTFNFVEKDIALCMGAKKASGNTIMGLASPHPLVPTEQSDFIPPVFVADLIAGFRMQEPIFLFGPTGCAKTASVRWLCAKFGLPLLHVTGHSRLEWSDLVGHYTVQNGNLSWVDGPLLTAVRSGCTFCFDEITLCPPETLVGLHGILDRHPLVVPEINEVIPVHPQFRFICTDNTNGAGDESGQYLGTLRQNAAFMNRCLFIKATFLPEQLERKLLAAHCRNKNIPADVIDKIFRFTQDVRAPANPNSALEYPVNTTISVRDLYRWTDAIEIFAFLSAQGRDVPFYALERAILFRLSQADRDTLTQLYHAIFS